MRNGHAVPQLLTHAVKQTPHIENNIEPKARLIEPGTAPVGGVYTKKPLKMGVNIGRDFGLYGYRCSTTTTTLVFFKGGFFCLGVGDEGRQRVSPSCLGAGRGAMWDAGTQWDASNEPFPRETFL